MSVTRAEAHLSRVAGKRLSQDSAWTIPARRAAVHGARFDKVRYMVGTQSVDNTENADLEAFQGQCPLLVRNP